jgi:tRNA(Ile)-lysidine synthetase-like protein
MVFRPESATDAAFVTDLCRAWNIPLRVERVEIARPAAGGAWDGLEAAARRARYAAFRRAATAAGAACVATGHTADDQAETVVMRLLDGAGPRGLGGIAPVRGPYIRPLLETRRHVVEAHLLARGIGWREDATNADPRFTRNRIRHDVLPFLVARWDPDAVEWLTRGAERARAAEAALETEARAIAVAIGRAASGAVVLPARELERLPGELAAEVLRAAAAGLGGGGAQRAAGERALRRLLDGGRPRAARLGRVRCERSGPWVRVGGVPPDDLRERAWQVPGEMALPELGARLSARCLPPSRGLGAGAGSRARRVRCRSRSRAAHRAGAARRRPVPALGRAGRAAAQDLSHRRGRAALGAVAHPAPRGRRRDHLGGGAPPRPRGAGHRGHAPYPRGDTRFSAGGAYRARVRWPPEASPMIIVRRIFTSGALGTLAFVALSLLSPASAPAQRPAPATPEPGRILEALETAFVSVADRVMPAVVNVNVKSKRTPAVSEAPERPEMEERFKDFFGQEFFDRFFRRRSPRDGGSRERIRRDRRPARLHPHQ